MQSPATGSIISESSYITLTAADGNGNISKCSFYLSLYDKDNPTVTCPSDDILILDQYCEAVVLDYTTNSTIVNTCSTTTNITQIPQAGTIYSIEGTVDMKIIIIDDNGNSDSCYFQVLIEEDDLSGCLTEMVINDLITPNGDGKNDYWIIHEPSFIRGCTVMVLNRWGQKVFESKNYENTWDGTYNNTPLPDGSYYYFIQCNSKTQYKGGLTILR